jgi:hypothetical protein
VIKNMLSKKKIAFIFSLMLLPACLFVFTNIAKADCGSGESCVQACADGYTQTSNKCNVDIPGISFSEGVCCKPNTSTTAPTTSSVSSSSPAAPAPARNPGGLVPCDQNCTLCHLILGFKNIFDFFLGLLFIATMLVITVSGVFYMISTGSKGMIEKAKKALTYSLTAFVIGMGSWLFVNIVMQMVGYKHPTGGNWWQFTCDTTQTRGPAVTSAGPTQSSGNNGTGNLNGKGCDGVVQNIQAMNGWTYTQGSNRMSDGYGDCSSTTSRAYTAAGCQNPGGNTNEMYGKASEMGDPSTLKAGDALVRLGHVGICLTNGCDQIMGASTAAGIHPSSGSSMINTSGIRVIRAADICPGC